MRHVRLCVSQIIDDDIRGPNDIAVIVVRQGCLERVPGRYCDVWQRCQIDLGVEQLTIRGPIISPACKVSIHPDEQRVIGGAVSGMVLRGDWLRWGEPGVSEHELVEYFVGAEAVLSGGVNVTADVEPVLGDVVAGQASGDLLLGFEGADAALADVVRGPDAGAGGEAEHVVAAVAAEFEHLAAGLLPHAVPRSGDAGDGGEAYADGAAELELQGLALFGGDGGQPVLAGGVPGMDEAAQRPDGLLRPRRVRVGLRAVLEIANEVSCACLVPGEALPGLAVVALVPVGDHDPGEGRQDARLFHGLQAPGAEPERGVQLGERAVDVLLLPGRPRPQRRLVEARHRGGSDQRADQPHRVRDQAGGLPQAGVDEPRRQDAARQVGDEGLRPLDRDVLEHRQVHGHRRQARADRQRRVRHPGRAGRDVHLPASAPGLVQVVLVADRRAGFRDILLLIGPGDAQVSRARQVQAAPAGTLREVIDDLVWPLPAHRRARRARLLPPAPRLLRPLRGAPFLPGRRPAPRQVIGARRHRGVPRVPGRGPQRRV